MEKNLARIRKHALAEIEKAATPDGLEEIRIAYLGRKGALTAILRALKDLPVEERKRIGEEANLLRKNLEQHLAERTTALKKSYVESTLKREWLDMTRPGKRAPRGHLHPVTMVMREAMEIFTSLGFAIAQGPEVETEHYNFDALNMPPGHPARDMWDTFWLKPFPGSEHLLLRTHTSPVQVRYMETHTPPVRIIVPGRVYRYEATDASHNIQFTQLEGLMVDRDISVANFKAIIQEFFSRLFRTGVTIRLRPSYFPFTEPSFEVDISCVSCNQKGCSTCKQSGWLELAGAGMVHPHVFAAAGYQPKDVQGFAFGMGFDRMVMMKYRIPDIRLLTSGDIRFLEQF